MASSEVGVLTGWRAERGRMYALDNGAIIRIL
jgi:hypothetical protein